MAAKHPETDFISLGPTLADVHTADVRPQVSSVQRLSDLLVAVLGAIPAT